VNFEPTSKGIIIRFNKTNRIRAYGIAYINIKSIKIKIESVERKYILTKKIKERSKGLLTLKDKINTINLKIPIISLTKY